MRAIAIVAALAGVAGCKHASSDYCDTDNPSCPSGSFCDTDHRVCIELVDGAVIRCDDQNPCPQDSDTPACVDMTCVQCDDNTDCADNEFPGCDLQANTCTVHCADDAACGMSSGVCLASGSCADETKVIYTMPGGSMAPSTCAKTDPCDLEYAMTQISADRNIVHLTNAQYDTGSALTPGFDSTFVGRGASIRYSSLGDGSVFHVTDGHTVEIDYITVRNAVGTTGDVGNGVYCDNGATLVATGIRSSANDNHGISTAACTLQLTDVEIDGNADVGITLNDANASMTLEGGNLHMNVGSGIHVITGAATIRRSVIRNNFGGGIELSDKASTVENCIIAHNGSGGSSYGGIRFGFTAGHSFRFNTVSANLDQTPSSLRTGMQCGAEVDGVANILDDDLQEGTCINDNSVFTENAGTSSGANQATATQAQLFANTDMPSMANYYRLNTGSPAVDHGGTGGPVADVIVDIDGQPRPSGNGSDSGADEVQQ